MLENLVANFEYPCIMDLKMGTRLHDDNATETKKQSHESKVNETTSGALGLRITGIQVIYIHTNFMLSAVYYNHVFCFLFSPFVSISL